MTDFSSMSADELAQAVRWAKTHDWGRDAHPYGGPGLRTSILVHLHTSEHADPYAGGHSKPDLRPAPGIAGFFSLQNLRDWAGY